MRDWLVSMNRKQVRMNCQRTADMNRVLHTHESQASLHYGIIYIKFQLQCRCNRRFMERSEDSCRASDDSWRQPIHFNASQATPERQKGINQTKFNRNLSIPTENRWKLLNTLQCRQWLAWAARCGRLAIRKVLTAARKLHSPNPVAYGPFPLKFLLLVHQISS